MTRDPLTLAIPWMHCTDCGTLQSPTQPCACRHLAHATSRQHRVRQGVLLLVSVLLAAAALYFLPLGRAAFCVLP